MSEQKLCTNVTEAVPFYRVSDMPRSLAFYCDGLGFEVQEKWVWEETIRWCCLKRGGCRIMLQDCRHDDNSLHLPTEPQSRGVSLMVMCQEALALYEELLSRGLKPETPFVGNGMWVVGLNDPDGFRTEFESFTDVPEGTVLAARG